MVGGAARRGTRIRTMSGAALSYAEPLIVVSLIGFWSFGLTLGAALIIRPELGTAIVCGA